MSSPVPSAPGEDPRFLTTRWSVVAATRASDSPAARAALEDLCAGYWYPLYAFLRRRGRTPDDAADLVQGFFARLLEGNWLQRADGERGRFRTFLLTALTRHVANADEAARALKRGGGLAPVPLEARDERSQAERRYALEPADHATPERLYEAAWAREVLERVLAGLGTTETTGGRGLAFELLAPRLLGEADPMPLAEVARRLGATEGAAKVARHRLRRRYRERLLAELAGTLDDPDAAEAELGALLEALTHG